MSFYKCNVVSKSISPPTGGLFNNLFYAYSPFVIYLKSIEVSTFQTETKPQKVYLLTIMEVTQ
jgi:hypothetical protein